jgi:hypothetical protein
MPNAASNIEKLLDDIPSTVFDASKEHIAREVANGDHTA